MPQLASDLRVNYQPPPDGLPDGLVWLSGAGAPTDGVTGAGVANIGSRYTDTDTGSEYVNTGSQASPAWTSSGGGAGGNPTAVWLSGAGAPTDGVAGTGAGDADKGAFYTDTTTGNTYVNLGTQAAPEWHGVILA